MQSSMTMRSNVRLYFTRLRRSPRLTKLHKIWFGGISLSIFRIFPQLVKGFPSERSIFAIHFPIWNRDVLGRRYPCAACSPWYWFCRSVLLVLVWPRCASKVWLWFRGKNHLSHFDTARQFIVFERVCFCFFSAGLRENDLIHSE